MREVLERADRLGVLAETGLLGRPNAPGLDRLTGLAARLLDVPTVLVSLVTDDRQVFAAQLGLPEPWSSRGETPLSHSFCQHVVVDDGPLVVTDARLDDRVRDNLAVPDIGVIAYAGMPVRVAGQTLGSFCAIDGQPRAWSERDLGILEDLAAAVSSEIALIRAADDAETKADTLEAILRVSHDAYVSIDAAGTILQWNPAAEQLFGYSHGEAVGADLAELIVPDTYREAHRAGLSRVRGGAPSTLAGRRLQLSAVDRCGRLFPVEFTLQVTRVGDRPVFHAFLHDITERRDAEEQLRRQAELIDAAPAAIIVRDTDGTIRSWNQGAERMYGWPSGAAVGRNAHLLLATEFPKGRPEVEESLASAGAWQGELVHRLADGRQIVALSRHVTRPTADGTGWEVIETNTDITERRAAEQALATSERQFRAQFHQSTIGQSIVGMDGRIRHVNQAYAAMLGYTPEQLHGRANAELTHPGDREEATRLLAGLFAGDHDSYDRTKRLLHADGHVVDVRIGVRLLRDADDRPLQLIGVVQDITQQIRAERERDERTTQLEAANQLKLDLMGMLSHDIGTPLTAILGYGEELADQGGGPELDKILRAAHRIDRLRHDVLGMCSLDAAVITTQRRPVEVGPALREALDAADKSLPVDCPDGLRVLANPAHLQQIVVNFLTNAAKYGGGATGVSVRRQGDRVSIAVTDEGPGVPAALRDRLFDRFTRADGVAGPGHGLGLHIVASLAQANGGAVAHRDHQPAGSVFALTLDAAP